jgi:type IV pilus assembly protein PilQ
MRETRGHAALERNDMSNTARITSARLLPALLAAACGLAVSTQGLAQDSNPFSTSDVESSNANVTVSEHLTVDLHVQDEELANVLQILSLQSQKNILVSGDVSATVNANLYNVTFYEALESILNVNGYGFIEQGNFIYVYTLQEIAEIEEAARQPVTRLIRLNYLNANDAAEFVSPLLSEIGQIQSNGDVDTWSLPDGSPSGDEAFALSATLVLRDYPEHVEEIVELLAELDTRPAQVLVEATILETSLRELNGFGIDFSFISDLDFTNFIDIGGPLGTTQGIINGGDGTSDGLSPLDNQATSLTSTAGNTASGPATFKLGIIDDNISFFLRALDDITDVTVLSRPKVMALNRQPARVLVGRRIGYLSTTSTETSTTQTVEFLDTGTQLKFRAFVANDGFIRMELHPSTSTGETREASSAGGAAVTIPEEVTQEITTNVLVRDGSTVVLGGLFRESTTLSRRQVPILGDIPLIGTAFRGHDDDTRRSEIIFMVTPTIVNDQVLTEAGETAAEYVQNVRLGTRSGLLPWSRDRQSSELNVKAERAALDGDPSKALYFLRRSLELNPNQPDAIRLREQILQQQQQLPSRSVLQDVFDEELNNRISSIEPLPQAPEPKLARTPEPGEGEVVVAGPMPAEGADMTLSLPPEQRDELMGDRAEQAEGASGQTPLIFDLEPPAEEVFETADAEVDEPISTRADDVFDELIREAEQTDADHQSTARATQGRTPSQPDDRQADLLRDLRLTVTVAPNDEDPGQPGDRPTTVTLTPETAYGNAERPSPSDPKRGGAANASTEVRGESYAPSRFEGSSLAGLQPAGDADESRGWDRLGDDPTASFGGAENEADLDFSGTGLIGPAFVGNDADPNADAFETDQTFFGGFWVWFRDSIVLDTGETDTDEALTGVDPDND